MIDEIEIADLLNRALQEWEADGGLTIQVLSIEQIKALPPFKDRLEGIDV
jgi:hypothetical protein